MHKARKQLMPLYVRSGCKLLVFRSTDISMAVAYIWNESRYSSHVLHKLYFIIITPIKAKVGLLI